MGSCYILTKSRFREIYDQRGQIGPFLKFLVTNYPTKVAQKYGDFWAILKNITSK